MDFDVQAIIKSARRRPIYGDGPTTQHVDISREQVQQLIPHRDPMLFVDRIIAVDLAEAAARGTRAYSGRKCLLHDLGDPVLEGCADFRDHFHPFFSPQEVGKKRLAITEVNNEGYQDYG